jgi:hypothetical protein
MQITGKLVILSAWVISSGVCKHHRSPCPRIFKDEKYIFTVDRSEILTSLTEELVVVSKISADRIPQWLPVPMPAGMFVQAGTSDRVREIFVSIARSFASPVPAQTSESSAVAFHRPSAEFNLDEILRSLVEREIPCQSEMEAAVIWGGRIAFLTRACNAEIACETKKFPFMSAICDESAAQDGLLVVEGKGAHRKLHNTVEAAIEWLPRELFVDPDEAPTEARPLAKVDIEAPAYLSPVLPVFVNKFPVKIHTRYVMPQSEGGYALTHIEPSVNLEISSEKFPTIWDYLVDAPLSVVKVPQGYRLKCVSHDRKSDLIQIPAGTVEDKVTVVRLATVSALSGLLAIAWFVRLHSRHPTTRSAASLG